MDRLQIRQFTAFEDAVFDFEPGVNVLIGVNGTGKSHVLKLLYVMQEALRLQQAGGVSPWPSAMEKFLQETFMPDALEGLIRRPLDGSEAPSTTRARGGRGRSTDTMRGRETRVRTRPKRRGASLEAQWGGARVKMTLSAEGGLITEVAGQEGSPQHGLRGRGLFLPSREFLTHYPNFISAWEARELTFDRTYYDLCKHLNRAPLKAPAAPQQAALLERLQAVLGGPVSLEGARFYLRLKGGRMEAPLLAEGVRKLAMIAWLVQNGSLGPDTLLLWDEPEASINPQMAPLLAEVILLLAQQRVRVVLATHDYVFASELSRQMEVAPEGSLPRCAFFALRPAEAGPPQVEKASAFAFLHTNPILDAMSSLYDRTLQGAAE